MRIIAKKMLREFWEKNRRAETPLKEWYETTEDANWTCFADVKPTFATASIVGDYVVFNIGGNKYRLITSIRYDWQIVFTIAVYTHKDYDDWTKAQRSG